MSRFFHARDVEENSESLLSTVTFVCSSWYDGYSIFQVGGDGKIHTHIADKVSIAALVLTLI